MSRSPDPELLRRGATTLARTCAGLKAGERAYVLANPSTEDVARYVADAARAEGAVVEVDVIDGPKIHGGKPAPHVGGNMADADVVFCLTQYSLAHSEERRKATDGGTRYLSLPDYSLGLLASSCLACDFRALIPLTEELASILDRGREVHLTTRAGTDCTFRIEGRRGNRAPGCCLEPGMLGSPPDAEVNIAPLETTCEGTVVIDGSIPCGAIGKLSEPITLTVKGGRIVDVRGPEAHARALVALLDAPGPNARVLGEFGIGLNPLASLTGIMLEDEGCRGTVHFGFGSNSTIGGTNRIPFHLDFIMRHPTVEVDGEVIMSQGELTLASAKSTA